MIQGQYRSATLQVPAEVTPLKFRGYLRKEIEAVQATAQGEEDIIVVRLFVLEKVLFGLGAKKVDSILHGALGKCPNILHGALGKCPNILRIELEGLLRSLTQDEMQEAAAEAQSTLQALRDRVMAPSGTAEPASDTN
ncbi:MAG: hypothetical protein KAX99_04155 [Azonexus sp.]|nr:hypothetical protein [Azonexus sp.]